jgi:hypothetical protein
MRKELLVAICAGTLFGVLAAFGIWKTNKNLEAQGINLSPTLPIRTITSAPSVVPDQKSTILTSILTPLENDILFTNTTPFSGKTSPNAWVAISSDIEDSIVKAHEDGLFQQSISLISGINKIILTTFDQEVPKEQSVTIVNSPAFPQNSEGKARSYMGIVTDKTENSLQIKDPKGTILLVSIDPKVAAIVRVTDTTAKDAIYSDIGIGDSIAALGIVGASDVLDAKRVLITAIPTTTKRKALIGKVTDVTKKTITFTVKDGTEYSIAPTKSLVITQGDTLEKITFSDLELDQTIIATGTLDGVNMTARRIQVLE